MDRPGQPPSRSGVRSWLAAVAFCICFATVSHLSSQPATPEKDVTAVCAVRAAQAPAAPTDNATWARDVRAFVTASLPRRVSASPKSPLVFFHQGKTAGTWVRKALEEASNRLNLRFYIPCNSRGVLCATYSMRGAFPESARAPPPPAVLGGHFPWDDLRVLSMGGRVAQDGRSWEAPAAGRDASCFTIFRDPLERLESCYYFRFVRILKITATSPRHRCLSNLAPAEIKALLRDARDKQGFGCLNEPFRLFSGVRDEAWLADLGGPGFSDVFRRTLANLARCVPLVLGDPRSADVARRWLPQFAPELTQHLLNASTAPISPDSMSGGSRCALSAEAAAALRELVREEAVLFEAVRARLGAFDVGEALE